MKLADVLKFDCGAKHRALYPSQKAVPGSHMPTPDAFSARHAGWYVQFWGETKMPEAGEGDVDPSAITLFVPAYQWPFFLVQLHPMGCRQVTMRVTSAARTTCFQKDP